MLNSIYRILIFKIMLLFCGGRHMHHRACVEIRGQSVGQFSPSTVRVPGIELRASHLTAGPFTHEPLHVPQ